MPQPTEDNVSRAMVARGIIGTELKNSLLDVVFDVPADSERSAYVAVFRDQDLVEYQSLTFFPESPTQFMLWVTEAKWEARRLKFCWIGIYSVDRRDDTRLDSKNLVSSWGRHPSGEWEEAGIHAEMQKLGGWHV